MIDFGGKLREARERRGVPLRDIAARTKISVAALEALERNDISKLPGGIFSRAFVRSYALEVGLDPDDVVRDFVERLQAEPPAPAGPSVRISEADLAFERRRQMAARVFVLAVVGMLIAAAVVVYFVLKQRPAWLDLTLAPQSSGLNAPSAPAEVPATAPSQSPAQPAAETPAAPSAAAAPMRLALQPSAECWVSIVVDGKVALARTMKGGERETLEVADHAVLSIGDAGAFAFSVDGRPGRSLGREGQSVTVRLTRETLGDFVR